MQFLPNLTFLDSIYYLLDYKVELVLDREKESFLKVNLAESMCLSETQFQRDTFLAPKEIRNHKFEDGNRSRTRRHLQETVPESVNFQEAFENLLFLYYTTGWVEKKQESISCCLVHWAELNKAYAK